MRDLLFYKSPLGLRTFRRLRCLGTALFLAAAFFSVVAANDDTASEDERRLDALHVSIWGANPWGSPAASREEADTVFNEALKAVRSDAAKAAVWELRADYFRVIGDFKESMQASRVIYDSYPNDVRAQNAASELIECARKSGDHDALLHVAREQIATANEPQKIIELAGVAAEALMKLHRPDDAQLELTSLLDQSPEQADAILMQLHRLGAEAIANGDYALAKSILSKTYELTPTPRRNEQLLANMATVCILTGNREDAVRYHLEALEAFPNDPRRVSHEFSLGVLLFDLEVLEGSRKYFQAVVDSNATVDGLEKLRDVSRTSIREINAKLNRQPKPVLIEQQVDRVFDRRWVYWLNGGIVAAVLGCMWWRSKR